MHIELPWPDRRLHPNANTHWRARMRLKKSAREHAAWLAVASEASFPGDGPIALRIVFCPPDRRSRDLDGMLSNIKPDLDGLADGWGVNDKRFRPTLDWGQPCKGGKVQVLW